MEKQRYFIELAYDGTAYHGWQRQPQCVTVQEVVEEGLSKMLRSKVYITGAGRTDTGVHATQMFAHFDWEGELDPEQLTYRLNRWIAKDISIFEIRLVSEKAHARFHATHRSYEYRFNLRPDAFKNKSTYILYSIPDIERMQQAANVMLEYTDFECFSRTNTDVKTYLCDLSEARFELKGYELIFHITANRFLRNMVRAIVGTLLEVGYGKLEVEDMHRIITSKDRGNAGASAPAQGLYLTRVKYREEIWNNE